MTETIFALSSGAPPAAIGVIRVSGPGAGRALTAIAGRLPQPRRATLGWFRDPVNGERLDRGLTLWFPGPGTATGEDLAEFHIHGGRSVVAAMLAALSGMAGFRHALPGEFTRRAFANGAIDLAEAEGLADLLAAETEAQRRAALANASGALSREVERWRLRVLALAAQVEAMLDFADEGDVAADEGSDGGSDGAPVRAAIFALRADMAASLASPPAERLRDGIRVVLGGPANAGKSTLLNALVGREAAIVSPVAGTTRDVIEVPVLLGGVAFLLSDTAGLRDSDDPVEAIGVARAKAAVEAADIIMWLDRTHTCPDRARAIIVQPCIDRRDVVLAADADVRVSAVTGAGMDELVSRLTLRAASLLPRPDELVLNARQCEVLRRCVAALVLASGESDMLLVAEGLRATRSALDELVGRAGVEDMLDLLFGRFCIGK